MKKTLSGVIAKAEWHFRRDDHHRTAVTASDQGVATYPGQFFDYRTRLERSLRPPVLRTMIEACSRALCDSARLYRSRLNDRAGRVRFDKQRTVPQPTAILSAIPIREAVACS